MLQAGAISIFLFFAAQNSCQRSGPTQSLPLVPVDSLEIFRKAFAEPEKCQECHPNHYREWQMSMHAYAFVDPTFFALNNIGQQRSNNELDQFCVKCHSPFASLLKETPPGFDRSQTSTLAQKGMQCDVCHLIESFVPGESIQKFRLDGTRQGPIPDPQANGFHTSEFDSRYDKSMICSACHNVNTPTGFQVEHTSSEWDFSPYSAMGLECQGCHMPVYSGSAAVGGPVREKVHRHTFVGVDIPLVDFPGRTEMISLVDELLKNSVTMIVSAPLQASIDNGISVDVTIINDKTGHNIPSGTIFERQMWIELILKDGAGTLVFASGLLDPNDDLLNHHSKYVSSGEMQTDTELALFNGTPYTKGQETLFFGEADSVASRTIPPFESQMINYAIPGPVSAGPLDLTVRLLFRSFPPYFLREIGQEALVDDLKIFEMERHSQSIAVN